VRSRKFLGCLVTIRRSRSRNSDRRHRRPALGHRFGDRCDRRHAALFVPVAIPVAPWFGDVVQRYRSGHDDVVGDHHESPTIGEIQHQASLHR
jgi:hypothetical protein